MTPLCLREPASSAAPQGPGDTPSTRSSPPALPRHSYLGPPRCTPGPGRPSAQTRSLPRAGAPRAPGPPATPLQGSTSIQVSQPLPPGQAENQGNPLAPGLGGKPASSHHLHAPRRLKGPRAPPLTAGRCPRWPGSSDGANSGGTWHPPCSAPAGARAPSPLLAVRLRAFPQQGLTDLPRPPSLSPHHHHRRHRRHRHHHRGHYCHFHHHITATTKARLLGWSAFSQWPCIPPTSLALSTLAVPFIESLEGG